MKRLVKIIKESFALELSSIHGIKHWKNIERIGKYLAKYTGADKKVIRLFALLHDSKRENEDYDSEHGLRASLFLKDLYNKKLLKISAKQLEQLMFACEHHDNSEIKSDDITIQTCWDADRLDLWRLGVEPEKELLNTKVAKEDKTIEIARKL